MFKKLTLRAVGLILFVSPMVSSVYMINTAIAQASEVVLISAYCPKLSASLQKGSRDASTRGQVSELQKFLSDFYSIDPTKIVTGYFGNSTYTYAQRFQKDSGLQSLGIVGPATRAAIVKVCGKAVYQDTKNQFPLRPQLQLH